MRDFIVDEWFVGFGEFEPPKSWYHVFTEPGWRHCFCFGRSSQGLWIVYDPLSAHARMAVLPNDEAIMDYVHVWRSIGTRFLRFESQRVHLFARLRPIYCVTCVKHVLGIRGFALTPRQLYRLLIRRGAVPVFCGD